jgi:uncharacterized membrane protein YraQ (UPF0718 family)/copper chaperone CopZ
MIAEFLRQLWQVLLELSPSLLLGLLLAGLLHAYLPRGLVHRGLSQPTLGSAWRASLIGVPMPLCSCGVVPAALALKNEGASRGATTAFLISTPQTGVDSLLVSASFLGWPFALFKLAAAFVTGLLGGALVNRFTRPEPRLPLTASGEAPAAAGNRLVRALRYALFDLLGAIDLWILAGVLAAALITTLAPPDYFSHQSWSHGLLGMLVVLAISLPLYVCTTGSVPIAASLIAAGMPAGSALVFLMAGPATNVATIGAVYRALGGRVLAIYLGTVTGMSLLLGFAFQSILGGSAPVPTGHAHGGDWLGAASAGLVLALMLYLSGRRLRRRWAEFRAPAQTGDLVLQVEGMTCQHCVNRVRTTLEGFDTVAAAEPSLSSGRVLIRGQQLDAAALIAAVEQAGYGARLPDSGLGDGRAAILEREPPPGQEQP